jgi:polygalacturonase
MLDFITPNDKGIMADSDSRSINNAVKEAVRCGKRRVLIPRINARTGEARWDVDEAIILPSDIEIILDNCYIRQIDGTFDNVFRNFEDPAKPSRIEDEMRNIEIRGIGGATIDGGVPNGLTEHNHNKDGLPHIEKNNVMRFYNVRGLRLSGFTILNQRWWAINLHFVEQAEIYGLTILTKPTSLNQDGIDLRAGCNNINIHDHYAHLYKIHYQTINISTP